MRYIFDCGSRDSEAMVCSFVARGLPINAAQRTHYIVTNELHLHKARREVSKWQHTSNICGTPTCDLPWRRTEDSRVQAVNLDLLLGGHRDVDERAGVQAHRQSQGRKQCQ